MSLVAPVENGKIVGQEETTSATAKSGNNMDKEAFLQLLVAQMQYQDPLEPTSNTEYISQYAQFSQVESLQTMAGSMDLQRAGSLVGKSVYVQTTTSEGESKYVVGKVDYVTYEGGKAYVYINEKRYALDDVSTVLDEDYFEAYNMAMDLVTGINKLPSIGAVDLTDAEEIDRLNELYQGMNDYQKGFVAEEKANALQAYVDRIAELRKAAEGSDDNTGDGDDKVQNEGGDNTGDDNTGDGDDKGV